jgi:hypothetical protein
MGWVPRFAGRWGVGAYWSIVVLLAAFIVWQRVGAGGGKTRSEATPPEIENLSCTVARQATLQVLPEASGLALSRRTSQVLWSMNDSDGPFVTALDLTGKILGRVHVTGADVNNWEDVSVAPCDGGSCLYISDAGNGGGSQRNDVVIYRVAEPTPLDARTQQVAVFNAAYPDGEDHESDAMFAIERQLFLVTKGHPSLLFAFPSDLPSGTLGTLELIGRIPTDGFLKDTIPRRNRITDAETSPDGRWVVLRTNERLLFYRSSDIIAHRLNHLWQADLRSLREVRGEGVAMSDAGEVYVAGEGGGGKAGTFAALKCPLPQ